MVSEYEKKFSEFKINQICKQDGCSIKNAESKFNVWKKNNKTDYENQLNDFFDQIHPY